MALNVKISPELENKIKIDAVNYGFGTKERPGVSEYIRFLTTNIKIEEYCPFEDYNTQNAKSARNQLNVRMPKKLGDKIKKDALYLGFGNEEKQGISEYIRFLVTNVEVDVSLKKIKKK